MFPSLFLNEFLSLSTLSQVQNLTFPTVMVGKALEAQTKPEVIIVGAGLAGLLLAQLLEQIDVPYHVYERAPAVKPLGKDLSLSSSLTTRVLG